MTSGEVLDPTDAAMLTTVNIEFTSATTYSVNGAGSFTYTPGRQHRRQRLARAGQWRAGDRRHFTVRSNAGAVGDNRNAFALADALQSQRARRRHEVRDRRRRAAHRRRGDFHAHRAGQSRCREPSSTSSDVAAQDAVSGVNLDEEAANMLRYQQAYAAAAQIIAVANEMFDTLLNAVRR